MNRSRLTILLILVLLFCLSACDKQKEDDCQFVEGSISDGNLTVISCSSGTNAELACVKALELIEQFRADHDLDEDYQTHVDLDLQEEISCRITVKW